MQAVEGDGSRTRHDTIKLLVSKLLGWEHIPYRWIVFNLFASLIPQDCLSRIERGRKRQRFVPDFMLELTSERGVKNMELAELKTLSCCPSRYNMASGVTGDQVIIKAVDRRANVLTAEYTKKAVGVDRNFGGVAEGEVRCVQRKLESFHGDNVPGDVYTDHNAILALGETDDLSKEGPDDIPRDIPDLNQDSSIPFLLDQTPNTFEFKDSSDLEMDESG